MDLQTDLESYDYLRDKSIPPQELTHSRSQEHFRKCSTDSSFYTVTREQENGDCDFNDRQTCTCQQNISVTNSLIRECNVMCTLCMQNASRQDSCSERDQYRNESRHRSLRTTLDNNKCKSTPVCHKQHKQSQISGYSNLRTTILCRLLHLLLTALFITSLSSTALATPNTNTHLSPPSLPSVQHTAQPPSSVRDIFSFPDKWRVEEVDRQNSNILMSDVNKVTLSLQNNVAFVGRLFRAIIQVANYQPDPEDAALHYTATEAGRNILPSWLHLDTLTGKLTGVPLPSNAGNTYISIDVRFSHTSTGESEHETVNEVFLITVLGSSGLISEANKSEKPPSIVLGKTNDQLLSDCASRYNFPTRCGVNESPIVTNIIFLSDFNKLKPQHRANLYLSVSDLLGVCPEQIWLRSIDWTTPDGMKMWTQLADADFKELLTHATILSFQIDCSVDGTNDILFEKSASKLIGTLDSALAICSNGLALDENAYVIVDCYQWFITRGASSVIHQLKVTSENDVMHKRRLKRQEETEDVEFDPNEQVLPMIVSTSSQSTSRDTAASTSSSQISSDSTEHLPQVTTLQQPSSSISVGAPLSRVVPSSDGLTLVPSQTIPSTSSSRTSLRNPLSMQRDLFNMLTSMPQFVMSSFLNFESVTTMIEMVITPTPTRTFSFSIPSSIEVIDSSSIVVSSRAIISTTARTPSSTISSGVTSTTRTTSLSSRLTTVTTLPSSSMAVSTTSLLPSSTFLSTMSPTPSLMLSSSSSVISSVDVSTSFPSPSFQTTLVSLFPTPSSSLPQTSGELTVTATTLGSLFPTPSSSLPQTSGELTVTATTLGSLFPTPSSSLPQTSGELTVTATTLTIPESSSTISFFFMSSSDVVFTIEPTVSSTFVVSSSRSVSLLMPMSSSELTLSVSMFTPSVSSISTSILISLSVFTPELSPSVSSFSEIFIAPTSTMLTSVDSIASTAPVSFSSSEVFPSSASTQQSSPTLTPSFSDFFEPSSTPIFFVTTFTTSTQLTTGFSSPATLSPSVTFSTLVSLSSSTISSIDLMTFFPEPTTTVILLTSDGVTSTPLSLQPTSTFEIQPTTTTVTLLTSDGVTSTSLSLQPTSTFELQPTTVIEPSSSTETQSVSSSLPVSTPTPIFSSSLPTTVRDITSSPTMTSIFISPSMSSFVLQTSSPTFMSISQSETFIFLMTTTDMLQPMTPTPIATATSTQGVSTPISGSIRTLTPSISSLIPSLTSISMLSSTSSSTVSSMFPTTVLSPSLSTISTVSTDIVNTSTVTPLVSVTPTPTSIFPTTVLSPSLSTISMDIVVTSTMTSLVSVTPTPTPNITLCDFIDCGNGTCVDLGEDFLCDCYVGWTGQFCDIDIDYCFEDSQSSPCDPVGAESCIDGNSTYTCVCLPGFTGKNCSEDINECDINLCMNNATCNNLFATFSCTCSIGFTGPLCEFVVDPCVPNPCKEDTVCINTGDGSFECAVVPPMTTTMVASSSVQTVIISTSVSSPVTPSSTFAPTPTPSSTFTPVPTPTPTPINLNPFVLNPVGTILTNEGQLFQFLIPDDTFYDLESGTTNQLSLSLLDLRGSPLPNTTWVQLRYMSGNVAVIEGIPLRDQVLSGSLTDHVFLLRAEDDAGGVAHDLVTIRVIPAAEAFQSFLTVFFEGEFEVFNQNLTAKIALFMALSSFGNPNSNDVYIGSFSSGSIAVSYHNLSISDLNCADFREWFDSIFSNSAYTEAFISSLVPFIPTKAPQITGPCNSSDTNPTSPSTIRLVNPTLQSGRVLLFATVIPAILLAILCLAIGILALVLYRRRRSEREYLYNPEMRRTFLHRRPIILEEEADFPVRGRRPVVLTNDLAIRDEDEHHGLHGRRPLLEEVDYESEPSDDEDEEIMTAPLTPQRDPFPEEEPPEYLSPPIYSYARLRFL